MKIVYITLVLLLGIAISAAAASFNSSNGNVLISAPVIEYATPKINASGGVHLESKDPVQKSTFIADSQSVTVILGTSPGAKAGSTLSMIKTAYMQGPVKIVYLSMQDGVQIKSTASADKASYSGPDGQVILTGNVKITNENPALFDVPATASGDKATINLNPGKDGEAPFRFRIESTSGLSKIEVTPKQGQDNK